MSAGAHPRTRAKITEHSLHWPHGPTGSTHELAIDETSIYVSGQNMDLVARCDHAGNVLTRIACAKARER